jgi:hypothetical protein
MKLLKIIMTLFVAMLITGNTQAHTQDGAIEDTKALATNTYPCADYCYVRDSSFNPSFSMILNAKYQQFSADSGDFAGGWFIGHEGERAEQEGFGLDHTEFAVAANVDDKFRGSSVFAIVEHDGKTELELEEAYIETLPGFGLPSGMSVKVGRAFWTLGYLNEHHSHADDFADRPLPYRAFFDKHFNDDGAQVSYVLPTDLYTEIGAATLRGNDFPFGTSNDEGNEAWSAYARIGTDFGKNQSIRIGGYILSGNTGAGRSLMDEHADHAHEGEEDGHEITAMSFSGNSDLMIADVRYTWAPTGNSTEKEVTLQAEFFQRIEDGIYNISEHGEEVNAGVTNEVTITESFTFNEVDSSGWYAQAVYKFAPQWRVGVRYSQLQSPDVPSDFAGEHEGEFDPAGYNPEAYSFMVDYSNSEFSRLRLQVNQEELSDGNEDTQVVLQYIMSLGAHSAHTY